MLWFFLLLNILVGNAQNVEPVPVLASEQPRISLDSLKYEMEQFRAIGRLKSSRHKLETAISRRDQMKKELDRMQSLSKSSGASELQLELAELNLQKAENAVNHSRHDVQRATTEAVVSKIKLLNEGDPGVDRRAELANAMLEGLKSERQSHQDSLVNLRKNASYYEKRLKAGKFLLDRNVISQNEYERRILDSESANSLVQSSIDEIEALENSIRGLEASQKVL